MPENLNSLERIIERNKSVIDLIFEGLPRSKGFSWTDSRGTFCRQFAEICSRVEDQALSGIIEIAEKAGVSAATVSRALRGLHHVNEKTRKKIVAAAQELDYPIRPDLLPKGAHTKTNTVGVIAPYISRWFFAQAINGIEQSLREAGFDLLLFNFSPVDSRKRLFQQKLLRGKVDALIVISLLPTDEEFESLVSLGIPITLIGFEHEGCNSVSIDDVAAGELATQHLINLGHREIALLCGQRDTALKFTVSTDRKEGYLNALAKAGIEFNPDYEIIGDFDMKTAEISMDAFLQRKKLPTAIFCASDEMALGAMKALQKKGIRVPEDISIIGFDNHDLAQMVNLTTISQPVQFEGQMAASTCIAHINKPELPVKDIHLPVEIILRGTTAKL